MLKLIIVRHGNSVSNVAKTFTGHIDAPLSEIGKEQANRVSEYLYKNFKVDKVYSSDLCRAVDTVRLFSELAGLEIIKRKEIREVYGGKWENMLIADIPNKFPEDFKVWKENPGLARCTGGESYAEAQNRISAFVEEIAKEDDGKTVVMATHGGLIRAFECLVRGIPLERMQEVPFVFNASISVIEYDNGVYKLMKSNVTDFLADLQTAMPKGI